jgi:hypothetical protein
MVSLGIVKPKIVNRVVIQQRDSKEVEKAIAEKDKSLCSSVWVCGYRKSYSKQLLNLSKRMKSRKKNLAILKKTRPNMAEGAAKTKRVVNGWQNFKT